jgi:hypothetical protein|tara:strand:+ start:503 stop:841 length:339 start_codon:yes stop_codon:yes gene_type:complete
MASSYLLKTVRVCNSVGKIKYSLNNTNFFLRVFSPRFAFFETHSNEDDIHSKMNDYKIPTYKYRIYNKPLHYNDMAEGLHDFPSSGLTDYEYDYYYDCNYHVIARTTNSENK